MATRISSPGTVSERGYDQPIPYGWFCVMLSTELPVGAVHTVRRFGREWVLFRDVGGNVGMVEPHCPHLGAHLGHGGRVEGDLLLCPFHNWGFDHRGFCRNIPYARAMPPQLRRKAALASLPVTEANRMIWAWYHPAGVQPMWEVEVLPEASAADWVAHPGYRFEIRTIAQEIAENSVDMPHIRYVHGQDAPLGGVSTYQGHLRTTSIAGPITITDAAGEPMESRFSLDFSQHGPGVQIVRMERHVRMIMVIAITPMEQELTLFHMKFFYPDYQDDLFRRGLIEDLIKEQVNRRGEFTGIISDLPIWDHKIYKEKPLLCDGDGKIIEFRKWFSQFYNFDAVSARGHGGAAPLGQAVQ